MPPQFFSLLWGPEMISRTAQKPSLSMWRPETPPSASEIRPHRRVRNAEPSPFSCESNTSGVAIRDALHIELQRRSDTASPNRAPLLNATLLPSHLAGLRRGLATSTFHCACSQPGNDSILEYHHQDDQRYGHYHGSSHDGSPRLFIGCRTAKL